LSLEHVILGLLDEGPRSGYELKTRCLDGPLSPLWRADQAQVYRTLERLRSEGLVTATRRRQANRPDRRVFEITHRGRGRLDEWFSTPEPAPAIRDPLLLQLHFGALAADASLLGVLRARREEHQRRLEDLREHVAGLARDESLPDRAMVLRHAALDGAITRERAAIDWLDDCIQAIDEGVLPGSNEGPGQRHLFVT
jgi:DNA-binding PadR family transcriptional regulator